MQKKLEGCPLSDGRKKFDGKFVHLDTRTDEHADGNGRTISEIGRSRSNATNLRMEIQPFKVTQDHGK